MNYINPFEILEIESTELVDIDSNKIKKAKRKLLANIELSDNGSIIYYNTEITKNDAMKILDDFDNQNIKEFHFFIFNNKNLHNFLVKGDFTFFYNYIHESIYKIPEFINFISPFFAAMYKKVFYESFIKSDKNCLKILIQNKPLVSDEYIDEIYKKTYQLINENIKKTDKISQEVDEEDFYYDEDYVVDEKEIEDYINDKKEFLKDDINKIIRKIRLINLLPDYFQYQRNKFAKSLRDLSILIFNNLHDSQISLDLLLKTLKLKIDDILLEENLKKDYDFINAYNTERLEKKKYEPELKKYAGILIEIRKLIEETDEKSVKTEQLITRLNNLIPVNELNQKPEIFVDIRNQLTLGLRNLSVSVWNNFAEIDTAISIIKFSQKVKVDNETKEDLNDAIKELNNLKQKIIIEEEKSKLEIDIRGDLVKINREIIQYKSKVIHTNDIVAIKYGIFVQIINGVRTSYYTIWFLDENNKSIKIECNRLLLRLGSVEKIYEQILNATYYHVVPIILNKINRKLLKGNYEEIGDCKLYKDNITIKSGIIFLKKEYDVNWSNTGTHSESGKLYVISKYNPKISTNMAFRDTWNAVLFNIIRDKLI